MAEKFTVKSMKNNSEDEERIEIERMIRTVIDDGLAKFSKRHEDEFDKPNGSLNTSIRAPKLLLPDDLKLEEGLSRSLSSFRGSAMERLSRELASRNYSVSNCVDGYMHEDQTEFIASLLDKYKTRSTKPKISDYEGIINHTQKKAKPKKHKIDLLLSDSETGKHYIIELKLGGNLDNKKSRSEKESLLDQRTILANNLRSEDNIRIFLATAYNPNGEGEEWKQGGVLQYFNEEELLIGNDFWNFICKRPDGGEIVNNILKEYEPKVKEVYGKIIKQYLPKCQK